MARSCRIIREVKYVKVLTPQQVKETVRKYRYPFFSDQVEIITAGRKHTKIPAKTREYAKKKNVRIRRFWGFK